MNGKKSKLIRKKAKLLVVEWVKSLLPEKKLIKTKKLEKINLKDFL